MRRLSLLKLIMLIGMFIVFSRQLSFVAQMAPLSQSTITPPIATPTQLLTSTPTLSQGTISPSIATPSPTPTSTLTPAPKPTKGYYLPLLSNSSSVQKPLVTASSYSMSLYMLSVDSTKMYNLGCQFGKIDRDFAGSRDTFVILDFGSPKKINTEYGADLFWMGPVTVSQIKEAVQNFGRGYYLCTSTDRSSQIYVGIGTTNYGSMLASSTDVAFAHGAAWAQMVNDLNSWLKDSGYASQVHAVGANDIELSWNSAAISKAWVNGYDSINLYNFYDFGTLDGCATLSDLTRMTCANGWTLEDAWYKAFGTRPAFPIPEIYNTRGVNAQQWARLSLYSVTAKGYPIEFPGVLTQYLACTQADPAQCAGVDNTPLQGWTQLVTELKKDSRTAWFPRWSTDIRWGFDQVGSELTFTPDQVSQAALPDYSGAHFAQALTLPKLDSQMKASLVEKLANADQLLADRTFAEAHLAPKDAALAPKAPLVGDTGFPVGIFEGAGGVAHGWEGNFINHWQDSVGSEYVIVSAGSNAEDPTAGLIMVMRVSGNRTQFSRKFYPTPQKVGPVKVVEVTGSEIIVATENGTRFYFNLSSATFQ